MFTSFIEDMLSETRGEEEGQEDGEERRKNVAAGETNVPKASPIAARGPALCMPGLVVFTD